MCNNVTFKSFLSRTLHRNKSSDQKKFGQTILGLKEITRHQAMATLIRQAEAGTTLLHPGSTLPQGLSPALISPPTGSWGLGEAGAGGRGAQESSLQESA